MNEWIQLLRIFMWVGWFIAGWMFREFLNRDVSIIEFLQALLSAISLTYIYAII